MFTISLGIMAYNEEQNIGRLLQSVAKQRLSLGNLKEIFVVASGCTDRTEQVVQSCMERDKRIRLLVQERREGKASAINMFLSRASGEIVILESADTIPEEGTFERLVAPFEDPRVGMTGAHPIPVNPKETFMGFTVHLMWSLHHEIALDHPKLGELVAFRNVIGSIPADTAVDEASIEARIRESGYGLRYASDAVVRNKGPEHVRDFIRQRRRIAAGHRHLLRAQNHKVSTSDPTRILKTLVRRHRWRLRETVWTLGAIGLEFLGRLLGTYDLFIRRDNPFVWDVASSTKRLN